MALANCNPCCFFLWVRSLLRSILGYISAARAQNSDTPDACAGRSIPAAHPSILAGPPPAKARLSHRHDQRPTQAKMFALDNPVFKPGARTWTAIPQSPAGTRVRLHDEFPRSYTTMTPTDPANGPSANAGAGSRPSDGVRNVSFSVRRSRTGNSSAICMAKRTSSYQANVTGVQYFIAGIIATAKLLPFTLDVSVWNNVVAGSARMSFRATLYGRPSACVGWIHECKLYPLPMVMAWDGSGGCRRNFGTVDLGAPT